MTLHVCALSGFSTSQRQSAKNMYGALRALTMVAMAAPALALAQTATCDGSLFLSQNGPTQLHLISTASNPMTFTAIGSIANVSYNALGYSPSGVLYALPFTANQNHLLTLNQTTGAVTDEGVVAGLPGGTNFNTGTVGSDGVYYVKQVGNNGVIYAINPTAKTATAINLTQSFIASDMAWVGGAGGGLYAVDDNGQLLSIATNGTVAAIGAPDTTGGVLGAQFGGTNGLFGSANDGSGFYKIDLTTGKKTLISGAPGSGTNDGANCPNAPIAFPADLSITKTNNQDNYTPGANVTYTIQVTNNGPFTALGAKVVDGLPNGITTANWSCTATNGGTCTASGTGGISDTIDLPKDAVATYTLTMSVPSGFTGNLVNTATVALGDVSTDASVINTDPVPGNNSATDTDTPKGPTTPGGGAITSVPTLGEWALMLLSAVLAGFAALRLRRVRGI